MHAMKILASFCAVALFIGAVAPGALAQQMIFDDWTAVQSLMPADEIVITLKTGKEINGKFLDAGASDVSIERKRKRESVAKDTIAQIHRIKGKDASAQWTTIGVLAGGGAGIGIAAASQDRTQNENYQAYLVGTLVGVGVGGVAGYFFGKSRRQRVLIYQGH